MKYPPVDSRFYELSFNEGMSDDEIEEDWHSFIDGLLAFHFEVDKTQMETLPIPEVPKSFRELAMEIISKLPVLSKEPKHASP